MFFFTISIIFITIQYYLSLFLLFSSLFLDYFPQLQIIASFEAYSTIFILCTIPRAQACCLQFLDLSLGKSVSNFSS